MGLSLIVSCERDDICAESTPTTPLLIIRFFDIDNPTEFKVPGNLAVIENGTTTGFLFNTDSIAIPLRTNIDETQFQFILNSDDTENGTQNTDLITFNYVRSDEYVSKACGFKVTYNALEPNETPENDGFWIQDIQTINPTIEDETSAHIRIFH